MKTMKIKVHSVAIAFAVLALAALAGCGGVGSGDEPGPTSSAITVTGSVSTPAGGTTYRAAGQLENVAASVPVTVYAVNATARTLVASGATDATGKFSLVLPAGINTTDYRIIISAAVGAGTIRTLATGASGVIVSPVTEATLEIIEDQLAAAGKTLDTISVDEMKTINTSVAATLAAVDFSTVNSVSGAIALAKNTASRDATVISAITGAISAVSPKQYAVFTTTDYTTGQFAYTQLNGSPGLGVSVTKNVATVNADAFVTADQRYIYVINRGGDNIQVIDPRKNFSTIANYSTGAGSNPHDIEIVSSTKAYITLYQKNSILIVNPLTGAQLGTIDLSQFADSDGIPEMDQMISAGGKIFVTIQRLTNYSPSAAGLIVVIDPATDTIVDTDPATPGTQAIKLNGYDPQYIEYLASSGKLYVSCSGSYFDATVPGGIDTVDPVTYAVITITTKSTLKGAPGDLKIVSSTKGYVVVSGTDWSNTIRAFNPATGALTGSGPVYTAGGYVPQLGLDPYGFLLVSDTSFTNPGVVFIDVTNDTVAAGPADTGLPPEGIAFISVPAN
jgi:hypothetical protein